MNIIKKRIVSAAVAALTAVSMLAGTISVSALDYGSEWGDRNQLTVTPSDSYNSSAGTSGSAMTPSGAKATYSDVPESFWAYNAVERCSAAHWFSGYPDGTFRPEGEILRAEAMKVFVEILGLPKNDVTNSTYYDVNPTEWYAPFIEAGKTLFPDRTALDGQAKFQPEMPITREDTAYALVKTLGYDSEVNFVDESVLNMFSDQKSISTNLRPYLAWAVSDGLISGYPNGTIGAQEPLARAEFATMLYRANMTHGFNNTGTVNKVTSNIVIDPSTYKEIMVGESFEITAVINYSDGSSEDYTNHLNPYTEDQNSIVVTNKNKVTGAKEGTVIIQYNDDQLRDQQLVVEVKANPDVTVTESPAIEPEPPVKPEIPPEVPDDPEKVKGKVELAFVIDSTGSMGDDIYNVRENVKEFTKHLETLGADLKISVVEYRDITCDGLDSTKVHLNESGSPWFTNSDEIVNLLDSIIADGGGDEDESVIDAYSRILDNTYMDWSGDAYKFTVLLTDAGFKTETADKYSYTSLDDIVSKLEEKNINSSVITNTDIFSIYNALISRTGGIQADINSDFAAVLSNLADTIVSVSMTE